MPTLRAMLILPAALLLPALAVLVPSSARAAADPPACSQSGSLRAPGDIDGDGRADAVVGAPEARAGSTLNAGAFDVHLANGATQQFTEPGGPAANDYFGTAILQVPTGDPATSCYGALVSATNTNDHGAVYAYLPSTSGLVAPSSALTGPTELDNFGAALAVSGTSLYVGAPGTDVDGHRSAGAVYEYAFTPSTLTIGSLQRVITQNLPGIPGTAERGDDFGATLAATVGGVAIGSPGEKIGHKGLAGLVTILGTGASPTAKAWSQHSAGVPGVAEVGDEFGAALASDGDTLVVGIPGESVGQAQEAGQVQLFAYSGGAYHPTSAYKQNSPGITGTSESRDNFGATVAVAHNVGCPTTIVVGAPGEGLRSGGSGMATLIYPPSSCALAGTSVGLTDGGRLAGPSQATDVSGGLSVLAGSTAPGADPSTGEDTLLIGAPATDAAGTAGAGAVIEYHLGQSATRLTAVAGPSLLAMYGESIGHR